MPYYEFECAAGHLTDDYRTMETRNDPLRCDCGKLAHRVISATQGIVKFPAAGGREYVSPASGKYITTERQRRDDLARTDCRPYEGLESETKEAARKRAAEEKKQDAKLHENVSRAYYQLPPSKRKVLAAG
jgi:putative FmdB family regulatory protein